jgi:YidC/Oxa1 family membrane protein insertase
MLDPLYEGIAWLLSFFYSIVPDLGVSIILLTFTVMLLLFPLTQKQAKSMIAMQRVQPEVKKLQAKYKHDRQKLNEEMMKFYQEQKINPLAGCLPLLLQMPIFIALFNVLRDAQKHVPLDSDLFRALCGGQTRGACDAGDGRNVTHLGFIDVGFLDLSKTATDSHADLFSALPYFVLVGLVILCGWLQTRQSQKRTPAANKSMAMVMRILPIFFGLISLQFPAGLVLYFFVSSLWRLGQQEVIFRRFGSATTTGKSGAIDVASKDRASGKPAPAKAIAPEPEPEDVADAGAAPTPPSTPAPEPRPAQPAPQGRAGGLRGRMGLPPPPDPNGGRSPAPAARPRAGQGGTGGSGPPPQRRRRNKKKRKR